MTLDADQRPFTLNSSDCTLHAADDAVLHAEQTLDPDDTTDGDGGGGCRGSGVLRVGTAQSTRPSAPAPAPASAAAAPASESARARPAHFSLTPHSLRAAVRARFVAPCVQDMRAYSAARRSVVSR